MQIVLTYTSILRNTVSSKELSLKEKEHYQVSKRKDLKIFIHSIMFLKRK